jgi:hypothetical protein
MEFINNLKSEYTTKRTVYDTTKEAIEKKIARLEKKRGKLVYPHWTDHLVRPIIAEVERRTPDIKWDIDKERLTTFGLRCECPIFGKTTDGHTVGITFTPGNDIPRYDTGRSRNLYDHDTIGAWNGMNNVSKPIESIDELVALVRQKEQAAIHHAGSNRVESSEETI